MRLQQLHEIRRGRIAHVDGAPIIPCGDEDAVCRGRQRASGVHYLRPPTRRQCDRIRHRATVARSNILRRQRAQVALVKDAFAARNRFFAQPNDEVNEGSLQLSADFAKHDPKWQRIKHTKRSSCSPSLLSVSLSLFLSLMLCVPLSFGPMYSALI
eukprot:Opistho-1_new@11252